MRRELLVRLYPARWRARYEDEFRAVLELEPASPRLFFDILKGAASAHLNPFPPAEEIAVTRPRFQLVASLLAALAVLPAVVFLGSGIARGLQPVQHEPSRTADAIVHAFEAFPALANVGLLLLGPIVALVLAVAVVAVRVSADGDLRADLAAFGDVSLRLLRRPAVVIAALAALASGLVLAFLLVHSIVG